jgi:hypothetical protein
MSARRRGTRSSTCVLTLAGLVLSLLACSPKIAPAAHSAPIGGVDAPVSGADSSARLPGSDSLAAARPSSSATTLAPVPSATAPATATTTATARCGRLPGEPIVKVVSRWGPHPRCDEIATRWANLAHADKACRRDVDCALVGYPAITCSEDSVTVSASHRPEFEEAPCANPAAGPCAAPRFHAVCRDGCCAAEL